MRKTAYFLAAALIVFAAVSCTFDGPAGPAGTNLYEISFQQGMYPDSTYSGCSDTYLEGGTASYENYGTGGNLFFGKYFVSNSVERAAVKFDISGLLPAGAKVKKAYIKVYVASSSMSPQAMNASFYEISSNWSEGAASWVSRTAGTPWTAAGGDHASAAVSDAQNFSATAVYKSFEITPSVVQKWFDTPALNLGLLLKTDIEASALTENWFGVRSSNFATASYRPKLTVYYTLD